MAAGIAEHHQNTDVLLPFIQYVQEKRATGHTAFWLYVRHPALRLYVRLWCHHQKSVMRKRKTVADSAQHGC